MPNLISSQDNISRLLRDRNIRTWEDAIEYIHAIPYGRTESRSDFSLVISENKGTCSSKHALLKYVADANTIPEVQLFMGIYKMSHHNTPGIGNILLDNNLCYIPEAHCYLKIEGDRCDFTTSQAHIERLEEDILEELEIKPYEVTEFKVSYHKKLMQNWLESLDIPLDFDETWKIREQCIKNLST